MVHDEDFEKLKLDDKAEEVTWSDKAGLKTNDLIQEEADQEKKVNPEFAPHSGEPQNIPPAPTTFEVNEPPPNDQ